MGVRDLGSYSEFLYGCKRPVELSKISVWVQEASSVGRKVLFPERENTRSCYHEDLELSDKSRE